MTSFRLFLSIVYCLSSIPETIYGVRYELDSDQHVEHMGSNLRAFSDPKSVEMKGGMCDGYNGIFKINTGDMMAASGTTFFIYVINQIMYAEQHNLIPWVHFTDISSAVYDIEYHSPPLLTSDGRNITFKALVGKQPTEIVGENDLNCLDGASYPGPPSDDDSESKRYEITLDTSGVWEHYFEPISAFRPQNMNAADIESCASKPFIELAPHLIVPGLQICAPWGVRSWHYERTPEANSPIEGEPRSIHNWFGRMREQATPIVAKYIHPKPWLVERVNEVNPVKDGVPPCLAMHIRHTDKANGRVRVPLEAFLPYADAFIANGGETIYLATDSVHNVGTIEWDWPKEVSNHVIRQYEAFYSHTNKPAFYLVPLHRSNTEALIDIYAMSRCGLIVHGYSAVSEAAILINGSLHNNSVNLDEPEHPDVEQFSEMVRNLINDWKFGN